MHEVRNNFKQTHRVLSCHKQTECIEYDMSTRRVSVTISVEQGVISAWSTNHNNIDITVRAEESGRVVGPVFDR